MIIITYNKQIYADWRTIKNRDQGQFTREISQAD